MKMIRVQNCYSCEHSKEPRRLSGNTIYRCRREDDRHIEDEFSIPDWCTLEDAPIEIAKASV